MPDREARFAELRQRLAAEAAQVRTRRDLEALRSLFLGRKSGLLTLALKEVGTLAAAERAAAGQQVNQLKAAVEESLAALAAGIDAADAAARGALPGLDLTLPGTAPPRGHRHPLLLVRDDLVALFLEMGYALAEGPEAEDDFHNFAALNIPPNHPARDMQDTLYLAPDRVLRTHTSNVQIRTMEAQPPPLRVVSIGRCFRRDTADLTHAPSFHQIEGLCVDRGVSMAHLKGTLEQLGRRMFGSPEVRLRPSYFPFTEPSAELDIACFACARRGCSLCKGSGWIELGGCGMVDPNVFQAVGIDAEQWTGFAFGFGIERLAMLKYGIDSIRLFFENDLRFLAQFPASS